MSNSDSTTYYEINLLGLPWVLQKTFSISPNSIQLVSVGRKWKDLSYCPITAAGTVWYFQYTINVPNDYIIVKSSAIKENLLR